jgi:hypothetical protein
MNRDEEAPAERESGKHSRLGPGERHVRPGRRQGWDEFTRRWPYSRGGMMRNLGKPTVEALNGENEQKNNRRWGDLTEANVIISCNLSD